MASALADRLNIYNHYLARRTICSRTSQRYRAVTPASVQAFASDQLNRTPAPCVHAVPGNAGSRPRCRRRRADGASRRGAESVNADEPWRDEQPNPDRPRALQLPTPDSATLANGLTLILEPAARTADGRRKSGLQDGQRREPARQAGPGELRRRDARRRHVDPERAADCRRGRAARRVAEHRQLDGLHDRQRARCSRRTSRRRWT